MCLHACYFWVLSTPTVKRHEISFMGTTSSISFFIQNRKRESSVCQSRCAAQVGSQPFPWLSLRTHRPLSPLDQGRALARRRPPSAAEPHCRRASVDPCFTARLDCDQNNDELLDSTGDMRSERKKFQLKPQCFTLNIEALPSVGSSEPLCCMVIDFDEPCDRV